MLVLSLDSEKKARRLLEVIAGEFGLRYDAARDLYLYERDGVVRRQARIARNSAAWELHVEPVDPAAPSAVQEVANASDR